MATGDAGHAMAGEEDVIVAGIGCGRGTSSADIVSLIQVTLDNFRLALAELTAIATETSKADEPGVIAAARGISLPLLRCSLAELDAVDHLLVTRSPRVLALKGTASIAEAAALVGAGRNARLLGARLAAGRVTCAIALGEGS
jgi:cobalt-precorrin 5A hydrolase